MTLTNLFRFVLIAVVALVLQSQMASSGTVQPSASASRNLFAADIFTVIVGERTQQNVVYSPASMQACLTLAYMGAEGQTASEMRQGLHLLNGDNNKQAIAKDYGDFLGSLTSFGSAELKMANGIFVNENLRVKAQFSELATKNFHTQPTAMKFANGAESVAKINAWVAGSTNDRIKNLLQPGTVDAGTSSVLVNAIYFKAKWAKEFSESMTRSADFAVASGRRVSVPMMNNDDRFRYAELADLDATALELPYLNTDLTMLILLPKRVDGLRDLERKLQGVDLNEVAAKLQVHDVDVYLPKFKLEFDIDLKEPLKKLGMSTLFSDAADFSSLFESSTAQKVSEVKHKAFLEVNEAGSEAAAATYIKIVPMSLNLGQKIFNADHPFVFAIRNSRAVYFAGHVAMP